MGYLCGQFRETCQNSLVLYKAQVGRNWEVVILVSQTPIRYDLKVLYLNFLKKRGKNENTMQLLQSNSLHPNDVGLNRVDLLTCEFFSIVLQVPRLVKFEDTELQIQRTVNTKGQQQIISGFSTIWRVSSPTPMLFKGQLCF